MTKNLNKELKNYYHEIEALLPCRRSEKRAVMSSIKSAVKNYIYEHPDSNFDDIVKKIGTPNQVVDQYYSPEKAKEFADRLKRNKKISVIAAIAAVIVFIVLAVLFASQINEGSGHVDNVTFHNISDSDDALILKK